MSSGPCPTRSPTGPACSALIATRAGFADSRDWLDATLTSIGSNVTLLADQLAQKLPAVRLRRPAASYLAWLEMTALGWGPDPAAYALEHARVALSSGPTFGAQGVGYARLNLACSPEVLIEAVDRLARAAAQHPAG